MKLLESTPSTYRTWQAVLQPTRGQEAKLNELLKLNCELYNAALEEREWVWKWEKRSVSYYDQQNQLTGFAQRLEREATKVK